MEFNTTANRVFSLDETKAYANDFVAFAKRDVGSGRPWVIGNEFGPLCLVWAVCEQDAFDDAVDEDGLAGLMLDPETIEDRTDEDGNEDGILRAGDEGVALDAEYAWIHEVKLTETQAGQFKEAYENGHDTLADLGQ